MLLRAALFFAIASLMIGCGTSSTEGVPTDDIDAYIQVLTTNNRTTKIVVSLNEDNNPLNTYAIADSDYIYASNGIDRKRLKEYNDPVFGTEYKEWFSHKDGVRYRIGYYRTEETDAANSAVTLPAGFAVIEPQGGSNYTTGDRVRLRWEKLTNVDDFEIRSRTQCGDASGSLHITDNNSGDVEIPIEEFIDLSFEDNPAHCEIEIVFTYTNYGSLDKNFDGGRVTGDQRRIVKIEYSR